MRFKKLMATLATGLFAAAIAVFGMQAPAMAAEGANLAPPAGVGGNGYYHVDTAANTYRVVATSGALAVGYCLTTYLDLGRATGSGGEGDHYDVHWARTCKPNSTRDSLTQTDGIDITRVNKLSVCYGPRDQIGTCIHYVGSLTGVNPVNNNLCARSWYMDSIGFVFYYSGGNPTRCNA